MHHDVIQVEQKAMHAVKIYTQVYYLHTKNNLFLNKTGFKQIQDWSKKKLACQPSNGCRLLAAIKKQIVFWPTVMGFCATIFAHHDVVFMLHHGEV